MNFRKTLNSFNQGNFQHCLQDELKYLLNDALLSEDKLLLKTEMQYTGMLKPDGFSFSLMSTSENCDSITIRLGVYFEEMMTTCPCSGEEAEYANLFCNRALIIDKKTAQGIITKGNQGEE